MVEYIEVGIENNKAGVKLSGVTFIIGTGKSLFLEIVYKVLSSIGKKIPSIKRSWQFYAENGDVSLSISVAKSRYRQTIVAQGQEVVFEYLPQRRVHRLIKPIDMSVAAADVVIPEIRTEEHVSVIAEEDIERLNALLSIARKRLGVKTQILGPYISPKSLVDATLKSSTLNRYARNLPLVLSYLSLYRPTAYDTIRNTAKKYGFTLSIGVAKPGRVGALVSTKSSKMLLSKAPCSLKSVLAIATALELKPDILLIDNFDYCLTRKSAEVLSSLIRQKQTRIIAEIHNEDVIDWFDLPSKNVVSIRL